MAHSPPYVGHGVLPCFDVDEGQQSVHEQADASKKKHGCHAPSGDEMREPVHVHVVEVTHERPAEAVRLVLGIEWFRQ